MGKVYRLGQQDIFFHYMTAHTFLLNQFIFCKEEVVATHV